jgi:hypothetical protein
MRRQRGKGRERNGPIEDSHGVEMRDREHKLCGIEACPLLGEASESLDKLFEVSPGEEGHADVEIVFTLEGELESSGEGVRAGVGHGEENISLGQSLLLINQPEIDHQREQSDGRERERERSSDRRTSCFFCS